MAKPESDPNGGLQTVQLDHARYASPERMWEDAVIKAAKEGVIVTFTGEIPHAITPEDAVRDLGPRQLDTRLAQINSQRAALDKREAALKEHAQKHFPHLIGALERRSDIARRETEIRLGKKATKIAQSGAFPYERPTDERPPTRNGDIITAQGAILSISTNLTVSESRTSGSGSTRLSIIIQDPGEDAELRSAMHTGFSLDVWGMEINIDQNSSSFGESRSLNALKLNKASLRRVRGAAGIIPMKPELPHILLDRVDSSEVYRLAVRQRARTKA